MSETVHTTTDPRDPRNRSNTVANNKQKREKKKKKETRYGISPANKKQLEQQDTEKQSEKQTL